MMGMMGFGFFRGIGSADFMEIGSIILAAFVLYFIYKRRNDEKNDYKSSGEDALMILSRRYAHGEITAMEYQDMKKQLENNQL